MVSKNVDIKDFNGLKENICSFLVDDGNENTEAKVSIKLLLQKYK